MSFWDTRRSAKPEFIFEDEKRKLIQNMDYLNDNDCRRTNPIQKMG